MGVEIIKWKLEKTVTKEQTTVFLMSMEKLTVLVIANIVEIRKRIMERSVILLIQISRIRLDAPKSARESAQ